MPRQKEPIDFLKEKNKSHLTKDDIENRQSDEERKKPPTDAVKPPKWLSKEAKKEFKIMAKNLDAMQKNASCNLISNLDVPALALWADAYTEYQKINEIISREGFMVEYTNKAAETSRVPHPLFARKKALFEQMEKLGRQFGLSPAARLAITLPPSKDDDKRESKWAKFGAGMSG